MAYEELEHRVKTTPARQQYNKLRAFLTEQQNAVSRAEKDIAARKSAVERLEESFAQLERDYQLELSEVETMQQDPETTAAELRESRQDLEKLMDKLTAQAKELQAAIQWTQRAMKDVRETLGKAGKAKKEYDQLRLECDKELEGFQGQLDELSKQVKALVKAVPKELFARYTRIKRNHAVPMAKLDSDKCSGCNMSLPTTVAKRVASDEQVVECENCGRILYI